MRLHCLLSKSLALWTMTFLLSCNSCGTCVHLYPTTIPHNILILTGDGDFNKDIQNLEGDGHNVMVVHSRESISERFREDRQIRTFLGLEREADKTAKQRRREWFNEKKAARKYKSAREALSPLADLSYADQLEQKKASIMQKLEKLTGNERKACPNGKSLPELVLQSREIGGLSCKLEGIIESPLTNGYRNKCEFSTGYSGEWKLTVGVVLGTDSAGVTVVEEAVNCPSISKLACQYASIFRSFLEKSRLPVWNMSKSCGFWRQLTVREGSKPGVFSNDEDADSRIAEVMLMVQVCTRDTNEAVVATEFEELAKAFAEGARASSPPLPLTVLVVQDHVGISNFAQPDCPLRLLPIQMSDNGTHHDQPTNVLTEALIHDHINNLRFSISPTALFRFNTGAAEKLYSLAGDWSDLCPDTLLFDVYCGTGTIGLTLAHRVRMAEYVMSSLLKDEISNAIAIVDPGYPGLHPDVIEALRTHPGLKTLVYISLSPEKLVANAIELCRPSFEKTGQENKAKKMPASEPFKPVKAMAVDLSPHTHYCEMVMLFNR
ncbi:BnaCnng36030D [Brassica napus]|uniref:BnaCnng36030D protein n=6 Tax=Brassica TaxID=3705 RepID=A0A078J8Y8_BRANA|nr:BnaCnng36030D [Brassica napus]